MLFLGFFPLRTSSMALHLRMVPPRNQLHTIDEMGSAQREPAPGLEIGLCSTFIKVLASGGLEIKVKILYIYKLEKNYKCYLRNKNVV